MSEPFRNERDAAMERVARLEEENHALKAKLDAKNAGPSQVMLPVAPPSRGMSPILLVMLVAVPLLFILLGIGAAFFLLRSAPPPPEPVRVGLIDSPATR